MSLIYDRRSWHIKYFICAACQSSCHQMKTYKKFPRRKLIPTKIILSSPEKGDKATNINGSPFQLLCRQFWNWLMEFINCSGQRQQFAKVRFESRALVYGYPYIRSGQFSALSQGKDRGHLQTPFFKDVWKRERGKEVPIRLWTNPGLFLKSEIVMMENPDQYGSG